MTDHYIQVLADALGELSRAINALLENTHPSTRLPRPRQFEIAPGIVWPRNSSVIVTYDIDVIVTSDNRRSYSRKLASDRRVLAAEICQACGYRPRLVLRALRRIQAATAWCLARAEGRRRAAQDILRQQQAAQEVLDVEVVLVALKQ